MPQNNEYNILFNHIIDAAKLNQKRHCFVLIGGCSRSGKTTLANTILKDLKKRGIDSMIVPLDHWIIGTDKRKEGETVRERFDYGAIYNSISDLIENGDFNLTKIYDPRTRLPVESELRFNLAAGVCIVEGVVALDIQKLRELAEIKIYVDIEDKIRTARLFEFYTDFKGLSDFEARDLIQKREIDEVPLIKETRKYCTFIYNDIS